MTGIRQNLILACAYDALTVPVPVGVPYPLAGVLISPIDASLATSLSKWNPTFNDTLPQEPAKPAKPIWDARLPPTPLARSVGRD